MIKKDEILKEIVEYFGCCVEVEKDRVFDYDDFCDFTEKLYSENKIDYGVYVRHSSDGMDSWLQAESYISKGGRGIGIIFKYDVYGSDRKLDEMIDDIILLEKEIREVKKLLGVEK